MPAAPLRARFQSGGVIEMLEKLKDKFQDEKNDLEKQEMESKHAYEMLAQDLQHEIAKCAWV